jgi:hypothetical protein
MTNLNVDIFWARGNSLTERHWERLAPEAQLHPHAACTAMLAVSRFPDMCGVLFSTNI